MLLIDPHLELEGRTPDDLGAFEPEQPEELQVRFDEAPVVEGADRHRNGTRMEGLLERLDRGAPRGLDLVPFEDLADSAPDVRQEVQEGLVRLADRLAEQDRDRFDAGPSADREPDRAAKTEPLRILRPTEFLFLAKVADPDGRVPLPDAADEADSRTDRESGGRELDAVHVAQTGRMPRSIEPEHGGRGIVEPDFAEGPFLRLADCGDRLRRSLREGLRIDQDAGDADLGGAMPVAPQPLRHVVQEGEPGAPREDRDLGRQDLRVEDGPVLLAVPPDPDHPVRGLEAPQGLPEARDILLRPDVPEGHREELGSRVAVLLDRRVVHVEESKGFEVENPHRERILLEQESIRLHFHRGAPLLVPIFRLGAASATATRPFAP